MRLLFILIFFCQISQSYSQNLMGNRWVFGAARAVELIFADTSKPYVHIKYADSNTAFPFYYSKGASNICDSATGKLLFSTTGMIIHDTNGTIMNNGDSLVDGKIYGYNFYPNSLYTQSSLILPKGNAGQYYLFIPTLSDSAFDFYLTNNGAGGAVPFDRLLYNVVDMNMNGGLGSVVVKKQPMLQGVAIHKVMMQACRHVNGIDLWLLKQGEYDTNRIYRFLVKADTIEGPYIQNFAEPKYLKTDLTGQYAFSKDGTKFAAVQGMTNKLFLADFDRCTGELNNPKIINIPIDSTTIPNAIPSWVMDSASRGVCFSPNGQFVYISRAFNLYQYEYQQPDSLLAWYIVQHGPDTTYQKFQEYHHLALGLDNRIYIGYFGGQARQWSVINHPDNKGINCNFCRKCLRLDTALIFGFTTPPNMPDYNLGPSGVTCWPLGSTHLAVDSWQLEVYPNPCSSIFYIKNTKGKMKQFFSITGELLLTTDKDEIEVKQLARGIYYLRCEVSLRPSTSFS